MPKKRIIFAFAGAALIAAALYSARNLSPTEKAALPEFGSVSRFSLTDSSGSSFSSSSLLGKVWVADFIFTSCTGPCPIMTSKMKRLQEQWKGEVRVHFVSVSIDPETDTPEALRAYAEKFDADIDQWAFLTGPKERIIDLASGTFKVGAGGEDPNLHTTRFVLVDRAGVIRGYYDSLSDGTIDQISTDIGALL